MIEFTIKTLDSNNHRFSVDDGITVQELKERVREKMGIEIHAQRLIFCGRVLQDDKKLADYNVDGKVVHLVQRAPPCLENRNSAHTATSDSGTTGEPSNPTQQQMRRLMGMTNPPGYSAEEQALATPTTGRLEFIRRMIGEIRISMASLRAHVEGEEENSDAPASREAPIEPLDNDQTPGTAQEEPPEHLFDEDAEEGTDAASRVQNARRRAIRALRARHSRPRDLGHLLEDLETMQEQFAPYLSNYITMLRDANNPELPPYSEEDRQREQRTVDMVSDMMHSFAHAYHAVSDINFHVGQRNPRLTSESIVMRHPIPMQAHINVVQSNRRPQQPSAAAAGNGSGASATQTSATATATADPQGHLGTQGAQAAAQADLENLFRGLGQAGVLGGVEVVMSMEEIPQGVPLANLGGALGGLAGVGVGIGSATGNGVGSAPGTASAAGPHQNDGAVFLGAMPWGGPPSADLLQNIVSSVIRQGLVPGVEGMGMHSHLPGMGHHLPGFGHGHAHAHAHAFLPHLLESYSHLLPGESNQAQRGAHQPQRGAHQPQRAGHQSQRGAHQPQGATQQPRGATHQPQSATNQPQGATNQPQGATNQPQGATNQPQGATYPQSASHSPQGAAQAQGNESANQNGQARQPNLHLRRATTTTRAQAVSLANLFYDRYLQCDSQHARRRLFRRREVYQPQVPGQQRHVPAQRVHVSAQQRPPAYERRIPPELLQQFAEDAEREIPPAIMAITGGYQISHLSLEYLMQQNDDIHLRHIQTLVCVLNNPSTQQTWFGALMTTIARHHYLEAVQSRYSGPGMYPTEFLLMRNLMRNYLAHLTQNVGEARMTGHHGTADFLVNSYSPFIDRMRNITRVNREMDVSATLHMLLRSRIPDVVANVESDATGEVFIARFYSTFGRLFKDLCSVISYYCRDGNRGLRVLYQAFLNEILQDFDASVQDALTALAFENLDCIMDRIVDHYDYIRFFVRHVGDPSPLTPGRRNLTDNIRPARRAEPMQTTPPSTPIVLPDPPAPVSLATAMETIPEIKPCPVHASTSVNRTSTVTSSSLAAANMPSPNRSAPRAPNTEKSDSEGSSPDDTRMVPPMLIVQHWDDEWVPVITRDRQAQRDEPPEPYSDAYLSGMPSRKRRCVRQARPANTLDSFMNESIHEASERPTVPENAQIRSAFREHMRNMARTRASTSEDYDPLRYASADRFLNVPKSNNQDQPNSSKKPK